MDIQLDNKRNFSKARVFIYLRHILLQTHSGDRDIGWWPWRAIPDISIWSGVEQTVLRVLCRRWASWGLVEAYYFGPICNRDKRGHWYYRLSKRGLTYINNMPSWYQGYDAAMAEVMRHLSCWDEDDPDERDEPWAEDDTYPHYAPLSIDYRVNPSDKGVALEWPFQAADDAHIVWFWGRGRFTVMDLAEAVGAASLYYGAVVAQPCIDRAKLIQKTLVKEALDEFVARAMV